MMLLIRIDYSESVSLPKILSICLCVKLAIQIKTDIMVCKYLYGDCYNIDIKVDMHALVF